LHVHPVTQATHLMIRTRRPMHVPPHWHSANETHTVLSGAAVFQVGDGEIVELPKGSFNYIPARMVHQAWLTPGEDGYHTVFITVDGPWTCTGSGARRRASTSACERRAWTGKRWMHAVSRLEGTDRVRLE